MGADMGAGMDPLMDDLDAVFETLDALARAVAHIREVVALSATRRGP
jgi:hypothetical protein